MTCVARILALLLAATLTRIAPAESDRGPLGVADTRAGSEDVVRFDFESGDLEGWEIVEGAFGKIVTDRAVFHNHPSEKYNKQGTYYLSTVELPDDRPDDSMTGVVESPVFVLTAADMSLLVSGGSHADTYVALCTEKGREVAHARGRRTETMHRVRWSVPQLVGKRVFLRVVDRNTGGWGHVDMDDFTARGRLDLAATRARFLGTRQRILAEDLRRGLEKLDLTSLRLAVEDLSRTFPKRYPGRSYRERLEAFDRKVAALEGSPAPGDERALETARERDRALLAEIEAFRRDALLANPLVSGQSLLFVVREQYRSNFHAIDTLFHTGEANTNRFRGGGALKKIDLADGGRVTSLVDVPEGVARDPDVHWNGQKIVFAMRRHIREDYHIWEIHTDGSGLTQLTRAEGVADFDPIYLPDGGIVFSSTREPKYNMCSQDIGANLYRMEADGANIHQITKNTLFDNHSSLTPDGRILYARWEYVDRNFGDAHGLWTVNPDGTNQAIFWGNNTASPAAVFNAQIIPGTRKVLCVLGMHHYRLWGAMGIIDPAVGLDGRAPVLRTWPPDAMRLVRDGGPFDCDSFRTVYPKYEDPWPLSDKYFLCSRMTFGGDRKWTEHDARYGHEMGIYLVDVFGNEVLVHVEGPGCYDPMPVQPRERPPALASRRSFDARKGYFYVADVYQGTHMKGVQRGTVKSIRVVESPEKRFWSDGKWFGQGFTAPGMNWHSLENKRILGTVPVEEDGSAYFAVPAETFVYFQVLDENGMMIQSMRSGTVAQPGELVGCHGCHESRLSAVPNLPRLAWSHPPRELTPWRGEPRLFSFMREVQPVLDKHCVSCHDYGKDAGPKLNLAPDRTITFNTSYTELWRKGYVRCVGAGPAEVQTAYSWGSHASPLVKLLRDGHEEVELDAESFDRIVTWIDINAPYYSTYACAYPDHLTGRSPLNHRQLGHLSQLTGVPFAKLNNYSSNRGPQVSFDRPELSPCLAALEDRKDSRYREALSIIRAGQAMLSKRPRADMPGFRPCEVDRCRAAKYESRALVETRVRQAIQDGRKVYDER